MSDRQLTTFPSTSVSVPDMERMAAAIASSGLFGIRDKNQALALMIVAQAEGRHPGKIATDYHIIQGRATLKADTMLARFQEAGGKVEWHSLTDDLADATFTHPSSGSVRIDWSMERANQAKLTGKDTWRQYPRAMLRSRVISEGVRTVLPGVLGGMYEVSEVRDMSTGSQDAALAEREAQREEESRRNHRTEQPRTLEAETVPVPEDAAGAPGADPDVEPVRWQEVRIHFGKNRGLMLEELNPQQLAFYRDEWRGKKLASTNISPEDQRLIEAMGKYAEWREAEKGSVGNRVVNHETVTDADPDLAF